jgi:hypothetical protein
MNALFEDEPKAPADGELFIRPFGLDGGPLKDPFRIFQNPYVAEKRAEKLIVPADIPAGYLPLGANLVVDQARQTIANLLGGLDFPTNRWVITKASFGTYDTAPLFTDVTLSPQPDPSQSIVGGENEIAVTPGVYKILLTSVDMPQPFVVRFEAVLAPNQAVGYLIREMGLWTQGNPQNEDGSSAGAEQLVAHKCFPALSRDGSSGVSFLWRVRT